METIKKSLQLTVPQYLTIGQYMEMKNYEGSSNWGKVVNIISSLTGIQEEEVGRWTLDSIGKVYNELQQAANPNQEFHSILEWNGEMYGYAHMSNFTLGEYVDLENLSQDLENNIHKIAAILYRPITKHRFNNLKFIVKQSFRIAKQDGVENVFDYYTVEKYDSEKRKDREESFKDFPVHIILGALSFFLTTANLYLNDILYSQQITQKTEKKEMESLLLENLSLNIGAGGGLYTTSVNPIYYQYQGKEQLQT